MVRLRDRAAAIAAGLHKRNRPGLLADVVVIADYKHFRTSIAEIGEALSQTSAPARVAGGLADDSKGADLLRGEWGGKLDKSLLIRTARDIAENLVSRLPASSRPPGRRPRPRPTGNPSRPPRSARHAAVRGYPPPPRPDSGLG